MIFKCLWFNPKGHRTWSKYSFFLSFAIIKTSQYLVSQQHLIEHWLTFAIWFDHEFTHSMALLFISNNKVQQWFIVVQLVNCVCLLVTSWTVAQQTSLSFCVSRSLLWLISIELVMPSNHLILCRPPLLLPSILPSIRGFSTEAPHHIRGAKYWSFSFTISLYNEYSAWISI